MYKKKKKNVHPVFEKLEFYLNLKNDFALTFIRDERRVYFFSKKKIPKWFKEVWKYLVRFRPAAFSSLGLLFFFVFFCKMYEEESFGCFFWVLVR